MRRKDGPLGPDDAKRKFYELKQLAQIVLRMNLDAPFLRELDKMIQLADARIGKEIPQSPVPVFDPVREVINRKGTFETMLQYLSDENRKILRQMKNSLNRLDSMCRKIAWPKT